MAPLSPLLVGLALAVANAADSGGATAHAANPIRKVVNMLQDMQKKVEAEGEEEEEMYKKYMCYCKTSGGDLADSIAAAETKIPSLGADIESAEAEKAELDESTKAAQSDRDAAKKSMADSTAIREKEAAAYAKEKGDLDTNIAAIKKAVAALEKGAYGAFLQTTSASVLRKIIASSVALADNDKQEVLSFLAAGQASGYAPQSGQIIGILKELDDQMTADLAKVVETEETAIKEYEALMAAKKKEIAALTASIETQMGRSAELGVSIANMKNDLSDTEAALLEDKKFAEDLSKNCDTKTAEWDEIVKTRNEELTALAETIKILNDDDALELFKKTLPSSAASFVQVSASSRARQQALAHVKNIASKDVDHKVRLDLIALALQGKKAGFDKVIEMIDEMVKTLQQEQVDDDSKKEYCLNQLDTTDDKKKALERALSDTETAIASAEEELKATEDEIAGLQKSIKDLDASVAESTEQRKSEHELFSQTMQENSAAKELLGIAKNRLHQFYNPKLHVTTAAPKLSREDQIYSALGGEVATTTPGGIAGTGVTVLLQRASVRRHGLQRGGQTSVTAPPPPPEAPGPYGKKMEESGGVIAMIDLLIKDLDTQMTESEVEEKNSQQAYTEMMSDSSEKRATDSKSLTEKEVMKSDLEAELQTLSETKASTTKELSATVAYIGQVHSECDWLLQYFDQRKEARASEISSLGDAKAVLSGADYALVQVGTRGAQGHLRAGRV